LADLYRGLSEKYKIYIFTTDKIQNDPALIPFLDNIFSGMFTLTNTNGFKKDESESYKLLCKKIGLSPSDILYIDDSDINVKAASRAGLHTILYSQDKKVDSEIQKIFIG
jgi:FMN phosphatase YigB (HAD superfamily)